MKSPLRRVRQTTQAILPLLALIQTAVAKPQACAMPGNAVLMQKQTLQLSAHIFTISTLALPDPNTERSRLLVLDQHCETIWSATVDGAEARFDKRRLGQTDILQFITLQVFGDGTGFTHRLLTLQGDKLTPLLPPIEHTAKDGFYLGKLADGGEGIVTWIADPTGESEAGPHPYGIIRWRWLNNHFAPSAYHETTEKYLASETEFPRANSVARALKLPYRDQTGQSQFMDFDRLGKLLAKREESR